MVHKTKLYIALATLPFLAWTGYTLYRYFFDTSSPQVVLTGIQNNGCYAGDVTCVLHGRDDYKVYDITVQLDGKILVPHHKVNKKEFEYAFTIGTKNLPNGKHALAIAVQDASFNRNTTYQDLNFLVDNTPLQAALVKTDSDFKVFQGRTLHIQFQANKEIQEAVVHALGGNYYCVQEAPNSLVYECFIPIKTDETPNEYLLSIDIADKVGTTTTLETKFHVVMYPFKKQNLSISKEKKQAEEELSLNHKLLEEALESASKQSPFKKLWQGVFFVPCEVKGISTEFGTMRTTQERGKYAHNAIDILGTPKTVIWASQEGTVVIKDRFALSGNTVVVDHGLGVLTLYYHLDSFSDIEVGDHIKKGEPIGRLGMTGYASGYHLHWELRVQNIAVDPMQWTRHDF
jgi:murein DD-endopeptidase MepM/ murein hydrolase activator NlpD